MQCRHRVVGPLCRTGVPVSSVVRPSPLQQPLLDWAGLRCSSRVGRPEAVLLATQQGLSNRAVLRWSLFLLLPSLPALRGESLQCSAELGRRVLAEKRLIHQCRQEHLSLEHDRA